jgi:2,4-dienoyl-CoA reductase-like NADH-dependent reductase (Old Yellow Enzyme family)
MNMFRWIVKLIRDEFGIDEKILVRTATLETDMGLSIEQVEQVLEYIAESFQVTFPEKHSGRLPSISFPRLP